MNGLPVRAGDCFHSNAGARQRRGTTSPCQHRAPVPFRSAPVRSGPGRLGPGQVAPWLRPCATGVAAPGLAPRQWAVPVSMSSTPPTISTSPRLMTQVRGSWKKIRLITAVSATPAAAQMP